MSYKSLLFCPDEKTARVVTQVLSELEFTVELSGEPFATVKKLTDEHFDALVVDCQNEQDASLLFKAARNSSLNHSSLSVAVVEGQAGVAKAFRIGANLVLSKPINVEQSKATLRVARGLLRKAEAAKPATALIPEPLVPSVETDQEAIPAEFIPASETRDQPEASPSFTRPPSMMMLPEAPAAAAGLQVEVEEEPTPALGVAEAALLESLPDALPQSTAVSTGLSKAPSSQLASNPLLAPATTQFAAEPPLKSASASAQTPTQPSPSQVSPGDLPDTKESTLRTNSPSVANTTAGNSAATATAPAKEIPGAVVNLFETKAAPAISQATAPPAAKARDSKARAKNRTLSAGAGQSKSDVEDPNQEAPIEEGSKKNLLIAAGLVLGLAAAGYFAWPSLQPAVMNLGIVRKYLAPQPAPAPVPTPAPVSTSAP